MTHIFLTPFRIYPSKKVWYKSLCGTEKRSGQFIVSSVECPVCQQMQVTPPHNFEVIRAMFHESVESASATFRMPVIR